MGFCRKCGHELADDVLFCNKCGEKTDLGLEQVPEMSKEDSIQLADTLREKYASAEKLSYEISENEKIIKKPLVVEYRGYSTFRFFWKWLIIAPVSWYFLTLIIAVFCNYKFRFQKCSPASINGLPFSSKISHLVIRRSVGPHSPTP